MDKPIYIPVILLLVMINVIVGLTDYHLLTSHQAFESSFVYSVAAANIICPGMTISIIKGIMIKENIIRKPSKRDLEMTYHPFSKSRSRSR